MEVGAVKQAFNNEVILLKKNLNQAKIHVIHKLTRKAKTLNEKKTTEHLKEKLKRKAESAINEVLIVKKIKAKDIAKFMITHTGEVKDYLNKPKVDNDKACARLVLHKSLQDKYKLIRNRFGNIPIKDLFMSRQERRKLKKEAREQQNNKKKGKKSKVINAAGDWDVEDVEMDNDSKDVTQNNTDSDNEGSDDESNHSGIERNEESDIANSETEEQDGIESTYCEKNNSDDVIKYNDNTDDEDSDNNNSDDNSKHENLEVGKYIKLKPEREIKKHVEKPNQPKSTMIETHKINHFKPDKKKFEKKIKEKQQTDKKVKENKNKNFKEKLQGRKFKKAEDDNLIEGRKVVDPFFITATGENYLSVAEPRQPDEVKEIHKQGNRQERRAAIFGHSVSKFKPRRDDFRHNDFRSNKFDREGGLQNNHHTDFRSKNDNFNNSFHFNDRNVEFNNKNSKFNDRNSHSNDRNLKFSDKKFNNDRDEKKDEKLHPSWEAKRKLKSAMSLLPAKGKKIVFDND